MLTFAFPTPSQFPQCQAQGFRRRRATCHLSVSNEASVSSEIALDANKFLSESWGLRPAYLPALLPSYETPIAPDDLAGLACEEDVESRIITGCGAATGETGEEPYTLTIGPFREEIFNSPLCADDRPWTLLVHEVNRHIPAIADVLDRFRIIPNWRVDDVMVSYATTGGGVGPHTDNYDVFLLQVAGRRRWRISSVPISAQDERDALAPGLDLRVLRGGFEADQDLELGPGDCIYVPPRCPHWGEALDSDCMTFSIGFRAPSVADLASGWVDEVMHRSKLQDTFMQDEPSDLLANANEPGLISTTAADAAFDAVVDAMRDKPGARAAFRSWFYEQVSSAKRFREAVGHSDEMDASEAKNIVTDLLHHSERTNSFVEIRQQEGSVFAYAVSDNDKSTATLYIDGEIASSSCSTALASLICSCRATPVAQYRAVLADTAKGVTESEVLTLLPGLFVRGLLYVEDGTCASGDETA